MTPNPFTPTERLVLKLELKIMLLLTKSMFQLQTFHFATLKTYILRKLHIDTEKSPV